VERLRNVLTKYGLAKDAGEASVPMPQTQSQSQSQPTSNRKPPVDLGAFQRITDGDLVFTQELIAMFIVSGGQQLDDLSNAVAKGDRGAIASVAHTLKGASANIHAPALKALAERMEVESAAGEPSSLQHGVAQLRQEFDRVKQFLCDPAIVPHASKAVS
jgi:HPt (histidine-containing phosphotransfer) domain-containing protein